jgi:hypothetical protein
MGLVESARDAIAASDRRGMAAAREDDGRRTGELARRFREQKNTSELHALRNYTTMLLLQIALHASLYGYMVCSMPRYMVVCLYD